MDFKQLLYEYQFKTSDKKKSEFWWKNEKWNSSDGAGKLTGS